MIDATQTSNTPLDLSQSVSQVCGAPLCLTHLWTLNRGREKTSCAQELTVEPVDEANIVVPRRERNVLNIQELESDITASGKVTAEDLELLAILKRADADKNGVVSAREAFAIFRDDAKVRPCVLGHSMTPT